MNEVFADSFYLLALINPSDGAHAQTMEVSEQLAAPLVTTPWVLTEVADALAVSRRAREAFGRLLDDLRNDPAVTIVHATDALLEKGIRLYRSRPDKDWPLTDCISFSVMADRGVSDALTGDRHFEQAGFRALLK